MRQVADGCKYRKIPIRRGSDGMHALLRMKQRFATQCFWMTVERVLIVLICAEKLNDFAQTRPGLGAECSEQTQRQRTQPSPASSADLGATLYDGVGGIVSGKHRASKRRREG